MGILKLVSHLATWFLLPTVHCHGFVGFLNSSLCSYYVFFVCSYVRLLSVGHVYFMPYPLLDLLHKNL